ncbi:MAG TPA: TfoX/Sxy family protein [Polyangia bacterium]|jgi:TfoX/Sxy family transcriptional regulator of competence genes
MTWRKTPPSLVALFDDVLPADPRVQRRSMFGYPCAFVHGNMFTGLHQDDLIVRLPEARRAALLAQEWRQFEPMPGRPMREYVVIPGELLDDLEEVRGVLGEALAFTAGLPPKGPKAPKPRAAAAAKPATAAAKPATAAAKPAPRARRGT